MTQAMHRAWASARQAARCGMVSVALLLLIGQSYAQPRTPDAPSPALQQQGATQALVDTLQAIAAQLNAHAPEVLRGEFEQTKQVAGFKQPLVSRGGFVIARQRGLIWRTDAPFDSVLVVQPRRLLSISAGEEQTLDAVREPGLKAFNELLIGLLSGDLAALQEQFEVVFAQRQARHWSLRLQPREAALARFVQTLELEGGDFVERVHLAESGGDTSHIRFSAQQASALTAQEQDWL